MALPFASQHSPSFPALLRRLGATVLVSTYQAGQLILLRAQEGGLNTHFYSAEKPMGLAAQGGQLAVGTGYQIWAYRNLPAVASKLAAPHDACYLPRTAHITGDIDVHEMAFASDGELWLVNTRLSCLCTLEDRYSVVPRWRPPFVSAYDLSDRCHLNGLALKDGHPAFATALGETDTAGGWRPNKASGGVLLAVPSGQVIARQLSMPHSPRWQGGKLWYLESGAGRLMKVDLASGAHTGVAELPGFTRGLDFAGHYAFVGLSQVRETAVFAGLPLTERVAERHCGVWVVNVLTGQVLGCVVFTGTVQEIFAVQLLPHRFPTLLDWEDPLLRSSYDLPETALAELAPPDPTQLALEQATDRHKAGQLESAMVSYREILAQQPQHLSARFQLGTALLEARRWSEGADELQQVIAVQPQHAEAHHSLGRCCAGQGHWLEALAHYDRALAVDRQYAVAHCSRGLILLQLGRYAKGWEEYEWRWQLPGATPFLCPQPRWGGEDIPDKTLLVHTEQGLSESLLCARFLPLAAQRCKKLILMTPESWRPLLATVKGVAETYLPTTIPLESFDFYCPLLSLPRVLGVTLENLPAPIPYLRVPDYFRLPRLEAHTFKVGVAWASGPLPPAAWLPLFELPGIRYYSLEAPLSGEDAAWLEAQGVISLEPELRDYTRTAALITQLDRVISVDTWVAHLAGALGKPVWVLLDSLANWYWLLEHEDSPWYPTARLFRQRQPGDWSELMERVRQALTSSS